MLLGGRLTQASRLGNASKIGPFFLKYAVPISQKTCRATDEVSIEDKYPFFSLLNITGCARGITIRDAKYPLDGAEITCEYQYGVSNEVLPGRTAKISVRDGKLLLIKICRQ